MTETLAAPVMPKGFGGRPEPRQEARSKVTGKPLYAADFPVENFAYGYLVMSSIARGRMRAMRLDAARAAPGCGHPDPRDGRAHPGARRLHVRRPGRHRAATAAGRQVLPFRPDPRACGGGDPHRDRPRGGAPDRQLRGGARSRPDVGQGAATIIAEVVAERLGVPAKAVEMRSGDTAYPPGVHAGASMTTASATNTAIRAAEQMRARLGLPKPGSGECEGVQRLQDVLARLGLDQVKEHAERSPLGAKKDVLKDMYKAKGVLDMSEVKTGSHRSFSWVSYFVEVRVHSRTREIRAPRMIGAFAGGYIINRAKPAAS